VTHGRGGGSRSGDSGDERRRCWSLWTRRGVARRLVAAGGAEVVGISNGGERGGGRSSGGCGVSAAACKQARCHASVAPRVVASATDARAGPFGRRSHGGDKLMRRRASGMVASLARARNRAWE